MPTSVGVRELKDSLSRYLKLARDGESIVVCDRGAPVAMLTPVPTEGERAPTTAAHLAGLAVRGLVTLGCGARPQRGPVPSADLSGAVIEDREERA